MSAIHWLVCPKCGFRFYIIEEQSGHGYLWFCPSCKHEFREREQEVTRAPRPSGAASI